MPHELIPLAVAAIGSGGGVVALLVKWAIDRIDHRPTMQDKLLAARLDRIEEADHERDRHDRLTDEALKALLFDKIARLHHETVERGLPVPTEVKIRVDAAYAAYHALGGNGVGSHYRDEMIQAHAAKEEP